MIKIFLFLLSLCWLSCQSDFSSNPFEESEGKVVIRKDESGYAIWRNGEKYIVRGAVGSSYLDLLSEVGGNTINVYHEYVTKEFLDEADRLGLGVAITINIGRIYQGADYENQDFVLKQREMIDSLVNAYKKHPSLLFWIIGNEVHLDTRWEPALWQEVNAISKQIHRLDPNHLTTANLAAFDRKHLLQIKYFCPDLDFLSLNAHHKSYLLKRELQNFIWGWDGPYLISEWTGPVYWNDMGETNWGAVIEPSSTEKVKGFYHNYHIALQRDTENCLGGFVFYWGEKQERTHTMFSMILDGGYTTQSLEVLKYYWKKEKGLFDNTAPQIQNFHFMGLKGEDNVYFRATQNCPVILDVIDAEGDSLSIRWELLEEGDYHGVFGGDNEKTPKKVDRGRFIPGRKMSIDAPDREGAYRLFVFAFDPAKNVATANYPFYVLPINHTPSISH